MAGPQEQRLARSVAGMSVASLRSGAGEWNAGAQLLDAVVQALAQCGPDIQKNFGGQTATAAQESFAKVTERVGFRSGQMTAAGKALDDAADALYYAGTVKDGMGSYPTRPSEPTSSPGADEMAVLHQQVAYNRQLTTYNTQTAERETTARQTADQLDATLLRSTETMKQVHGEPDAPPPRKSGSDGGAGGGTTTTSGGHVRAPQGPSVDQGTVKTPTLVTDQHHTHQPTDGDQTGGHVYPPAGPNPGPGSAQGPGGPTVSVPGGPTTPGAGTPGLTGGVTAPTLGGVAGALGGGALGGLAGVGGAVRGPGVATGGFSAGGPRTIGGVTRPGAASGTLGRGAAGVGSSGGASRGGARAGTGARGAGGGSGRAGSRAGSRGKAGGRGASVGGARAGRSKDEERQDDEFLLEEQDWLDDEGAAPGVLD